MCIEKNNSISLDKVKWEKFSADVSLTDNINHEFCEELLNLMIKDFKHIIGNSKNYKHIIFALWNPFKADKPKFETVIYTNRVKKNNDVCLKWNTISNGNSIPITEIVDYSDYFSWLKENNYKIHLWDFIHTYKLNPYPIIILDDKHININNDKNINIINVNSIDSVRNSNWIWSAMNSSNNDAYSEFSEISKNYYKKFSVGDEGTSEEIFIFEIPIPFTPQIFNGQVWYQSAAFVSFISKVNIYKCEEKYIQWTNIAAKYQHILNSIISKRFESVLRKNQIKTAIISILVDSYAHNISAHSLAALKWWFDKRSNKLHEPIKIGEGNSEDKSPQITSLYNLYPYNIGQDELKKYGKKYSEVFKVLGLNDRSNSDSYTNLQEIIDCFENKEEINRFLQYSYTTAPTENDKTTDPAKIDVMTKEIGFPIPADTHIAKFMKFLRDKAAFWSGVTRDMAFGGETQNLYDLLWNDFADNPLYLGTIAHSEGFVKLNINIELPEDLFLNVYQFNNKEKLPHSLDGKKYVKLDFARINLSIIDKFKCSNTEINYKTLDGGKNIGFSPYNFIYPGEYHQIVREELSKPVYNIFLPGGVVGRHSLFTIFENTIRNIKHFKFTTGNKPDSLNFNIRIDSLELDFSSDSHAEREEIHNPNFFKISVYLDHDNSLKTSKTTKSNKSIELRVIDFLKNKTSESIITDTGSPKLGGTFQDKICSAMLLNNTFASVDFSNNIKTTNRDKYFYNEKEKRFWLDFSEEKNNEINNEINGRILKSIYLWRGEFIGYYNENSSISMENENTSRFRFIYVDELTPSIQKELTKNGIIRIITYYDISNHLELDDLLVQTKNRNNSDVCDKLIERIKKQEITEQDKFAIYQCWNRKFLQNKTTHFSQCIENPEQQHRSKLAIIDFKCMQQQKVNNSDTELFILHGGNNKGILENKIIKFRSHGWLRTHFIQDVDGDISLISDDLKKKVISSEFIEVVLSKICIIDNRIYQRIAKNDKGNLYEMINLKVHNEKYEIEKMDYITNYNFIVLHLSYIESYGISEKEIGDFFDSKLGLKDSKSLNNLRIVITSGRGRALWIDNLGSKYSKITVFKPIESFLNAVEDALAFKDDFQLKYNLTKVLFGS